MVQFLKIFVVRKILNPGRTRESTSVFFQIFLCNSRPNRAVYLMEYFKKTTKTGHFSWPIKMLHPCSSLKLKTGNVTLANSGSCCGITTDLL